MLSYLVQEVTKMTNERKTYASKDGNYDLNPARIFDVVADLDTYMTFATAQALRDNPQGLKPATGFRGNGRTMVLSTEAVNQPGFLISFDLAEIVLSAEKDRLTLKVHAHPNVAVPSDDLHYIGNQYKR